MTARNDLRTKRRRRKRQEAWEALPRLFHLSGRNRHQKGYAPLFDARGLMSHALVYTVGHLQYETEETRRL